MAQGAALERPEIKAIAAKHNKSTAQVLLRWGLQIGNIILPKSLTESRIRANADIFDFELDADDMEGESRKREVDWRNEGFGCS